MLMDLSGVSLTILLKSLQPLLFPIETDGVKVYTIADCYPDPFGVAITKRFELIPQILLREL